MVIKDKILNFHKGGLVRLILVLILVLPASMAWVARNDYSGRLKIESLRSDKRKTFIGYHFCDCYRQMFNSLKNKSSFDNQAIEYEKNIYSWYKNQKLNFLMIKNHLFFLLYQFLIDRFNDVEKLTVI
jgi:hypothetical protein